MREKAFMKNWFMLTVIGKDRPGIVARVSDVLFKQGCNLGEASMILLGGNFTIMLMAEFEGAAEQLRSALTPVAESMQLRIHVDPIEGHLHEHVVPDVRVSVHGADRPGIVAQVTGALAGAGFNIHDLESDVAGSEQQPIYIMHMEGRADQGIAALRKALEPIVASGIEVRLESIDLMIG
jgi:glycine cleavage system transcriptional repressor